MVVRRRWPYTELKKRNWLQLKLHYENCVTYVFALEFTIFIRAELVLRLYLVGSLYLFQDDQFPFAVEHDYLLTILINLFVCTDCQIVLLATLDHSSCDCNNHNHKHAKCTHTQIKSYWPTRRLHLYCRFVVILCLLLKIFFVPLLLFGGIHPTITEWIHHWKCCWFYWLCTQFTLHFLILWYFGWIGFKPNGFISYLYI